MGDLEDEVKVLREKNNDLVQKVQYWMMTAAQRENEKLELMKEINQLRLKLSRIRSGGAAQARKLDSALQATSEEALSHLVQASSAVARTIELTKQYIQDSQELESTCPRWSRLSEAPTPGRVNKVPPLLLGGRSIQPVVALRRASLSNTRNAMGNVTRSPNQNRSITERALPMHMLQDVYIPLTRIDTSNYPVNYMESNADTNEIDESNENIGIDEGAEDDSMEVRNNSDTEDYDNSRRLDAVTEDVEPDDEELTPPRPRTDNPLEGPSWLLDAPNTKCSVKSSRGNLEPDSTTELGDTHNTTNMGQNNEHIPEAGPAPCARASREFTPTMRRRKRTASCSPPRHDINRVHNRVLKVLVAKMQLSPPSPPASPSAPRSPPPARPPPVKRAAPSPNGATDRRLIVLESPKAEFAGGDTALSPCVIDRPRPSRDGHRTQDHSFTAPAGDHATDDIELITPTNDSNSTHDSSHALNRMTRDLSDASTEISLARHASRALTLTADSDSDTSDRAGSDLRTRRNRKPVTYKEKPLNRKLRR